MKPIVSHLKVFGNIGYAHIPEQDRFKIDGESAKAIIYWLQLKLQRLQVMPFNK